VLGLVVACFQSCAAGAAQRAYLKNLVHPFPLFPSPHRCVAGCLLGRSPLPNPLSGTLAPEVSLPVASLLVLVFALTRLPELSACLGTGNTYPRLFKSHSVALYQIMRLSLKDFFDHLRDALLLLHRSSSFSLPRVGVILKIQISYTKRCSFIARGVARDFPSAGYRGP
jgi:hypothetical protein